MARSAWLRSRCLGHPTRPGADAAISPGEADCLHGLSLDDPHPLPEAIRTGQPQRIGNQLLTLLA
jgi:hypothetical protein